MYLPERSTDAQTCFPPLLALVLGVLTLLVAGAPAQAAPVTVTNGTQFTDTTGAVVHAHGGGVIKVGAYYYWFGENRNPDNTFKAVSAYRSTDLKTWEFRRNVLTRASDPELAVANIERSKVIYNSTTGKFVMWMHKPFAGRSNVTFPGGAWTEDISHGEMVRAGNDQSLPIDPCHMQYVYEGVDPNADGDYNSLPWRMGLLTQTNSTC